MFTSMLTFRSLGILVSLLASTSLLAQAANVKIIGPGSAYTTHDITTIALDLGQMLAATPGYSGSSATATTLAGWSLVESYYHPDHRAATRAALDNKHDCLVILPETGFYTSFPEATFEGVLQMSRRALNAGSTPLLLMPRGGSLSIATLGENSYRIGNGCGIDVVPGGYAVDSVSGLSSPSTTRNARRQAYLLAATVYTKITGLNAATSTPYVPTDDGGSPLDVSTLAAKSVTAVNDHATMTHYATSRHNSGAVRYRTVAPPNNRVRYLYGGTSTEEGINGALGPIITASGHLFSTHKRPSSNGQVWDDSVFNSSKPAFDAAPNEYLFTYWRDTFSQAQAVIDYNQSNLMPIVYDRHFDDVNGGSGSTDQLLDDIQSRCGLLQANYQYYGWRSIPLHLGVARLKEADPSIIYSNDGTHMTEEHYYMMASMIFTSALGKDPTPPAGIIGNSKSMNGFNVGRQTIKELAFLSETMAFTPESSLAVSPPGSLEKARWEPFTYVFAATGGTAPYTWSEVSATGLPPGLSLSPGGELSGTITSPPQAWQLVIKATDSAGAIHKVSFVLNVTPGVGSLAITPTTEISKVIAPGGPIPVVPTNYTLTNPGLTPVQWTAAKTAPWLTLSAGSGTLTAGASFVLAATINSTAASLAIGTHTDVITFINTTNGFGDMSVGVSLRVSAPPVASAGADRSVNFNPTTAWTPMALNPVGWYDATDASTIVHSGGVVSEWRSKSGNSHMLQSTADRRPRSGTSLINGLNAIAFDGANDFLKTTANPFGSQGDQMPDAMIMLVTNIGTLADSDTLFTLSGISDASKRWQAQAATSTGSVILDCGGNSGSSRVSGASGWSANQAKLLGFYNSSTSNVQQVWESGTLRFGDTTGHKPTVWTGMTLAYDGKTSTAYDNCTMGEVVIINRTVSNESRRRLEGHLAHKWGFASTLPDSHPYKPAPFTGSLTTLESDSIDPDNDPLSYTWSIVSGPVGFAIDDLNSPNPQLFFTQQGTYTLRLTVSDGYSQASDDVSIQVANPTPYQIWSVGPFAHPFTLTGAMDDPDWDDRENLLEFAFGTDPTSSNTGFLSYLPGGDMTSPGGPMLSAVEGQPGVFNAIFARRKNHAADGITYSVLFSADMQEWTASATELSVVTAPNSVGDMEAVSVPFPSSVPLRAGGSAPPTFFRVAVGSN